MLAQQTPLNPPPAVLLIVRETIKPGRRADVLEIERQSVQAQAKLKSPHTYLALTSMTGPDSVWWLNGFDSYAAIGEEQVKLSAVPGLLQEWARTPGLKTDFVFDSQPALARFRDDLSYGGGLTSTGTRYLTVTTLTVSPGHGGEFAELRKQIRASHERARAGDNLAVYQVESGMDDGTYVMFSFAGSLDDAGTVAQFRSRASERPAADTLQTLASKAILKSQTMLLVVNPEISFPAKTWILSDPEFWSVNPKSKEP